MTAGAQTCRDCGAPLNPNETRGLCPACLFRISLRTDDEPEVNEAVDTAWLERNQLAAPPEPGEKQHCLGDYELFEEIGRGGMGVIYRARQVSLDRFVAVKTILTGPLASADFTQRFQTEAHAAAVLDHPNIVPIYEVGNHRGQPFYSMRLVVGRNLAQELKATGPVPVRRAAALVATVARAVHYAHQRGVLHRDLKPANILLDAEGNPHVTDFGLAKLLEQDDGLTLTQVALGTPNYMAPEQAAGKTKQTSVAADVYSLGAILWELLTGRRLFDGLTPLATIAQVLEKDPPHPSSLNRAIPRDLDTICLKCLQKEPDRRYESALKFAEDLDHWLEGEPIEAAPVGPVGRTWRWCRRKPVLAAMVGAVIALLLTVTVLSVTSARRITGEFQRAEQNAKELRLNLYVADMNLANQAVTDTNLGLARELIRKYLPNSPPVQGGTVARADVKPAEDLRGWEWRYLWRRYQGNSLSTLHGHSNFATCALFSPDGKVLVTASFDQTVRIWDVTTKRTVRCLTGFAGPLQRNSAAFSPDGRLLAVADGTEIHVFDTTTWAEMRTLSNAASAGRMFSLPIVFSPDGRSLWCNADGEIRRWDTHSWERRTSQLQSQAADFGAFLALSADGRRIATATADGVVVWDVSADTLRKHFFGRLVWPASVAFSPDAKLVAAVGLDGVAIVWDASEGREVSRLRGDPMLNLAVAFSTDGKCLAVGGADQVLRLWEIKEGRLVASLKGHYNEIWALAFSPDGRTLVSSSKDGTARLWTAMPEISAGGLVTRGKPLHFSPDSTTAALVSTNSSVDYWDVRSGKPVSHFSVPDGLGQLDGITASLDGRLVALVSTNGTARVWDRGSGERIAELVLDTPPKWPRAVFSPDNSLLAISCGPRNSGGGGWTVLWDFRLGKRTTLPGDDVYRPSFSPDGRILATGSGSNVQLWSVPDLKPLITLRGHKWDIRSFAFSPDGSMLASAARDNDVCLWDVATGRLRATLSGYQSVNEVGGAAFSPDGRTLAVGEATLVRLWNVATGKPLLTIKGLDRYVSPPMFSPDGNTLLVGGSVYSAASVPVELHQAASMEEIEAVEQAETRLR